MIRDANRAADVIVRLRELFKKRATRLVQVDLSTAVREVLALMRVELQRSRAQVRTEFAPELPPVEGDRVQLQQVIMNLIVNALEAMSPVADRRLEIRTHVQEGDVCVSVRDTGIGIDQENAERMFEAFYTRKVGGMGMGLSISRSIIEAHRGRLWSARNEGPGATFAFSLRAAPSAQRRDDAPDE
jgi:C4-dicarboxylate-specific signal transduction histidine kinase